VALEDVVAEANRWLHVNGVPVQTAGGRKWHPQKARDHPPTPRTGRITAQNPARAPRTFNGNPRGVIHPRIGVITTWETVEMDVS
jgi:hypothetical protein